MTRFLILAIVIATIVAGCVSSQKKREAKHQEEERKHQQETTVNLGIVEAETVNAIEEIDKVKALLRENPPNVGMAQARADSVRGSLGKILPGVRLAGKQALVAKKDYDAITVRVGELMNDRDHNLLSVLTTLIIAGIVIGVGGIFCSAIAPKIPGVPILSAGGDIAMCGGVLVGVALCVRTYVRAVGPYEWIFGVTISVTASVAVVWFVYKNLRRVKFKTAIDDARKALNHVNAKVQENVPQLAAQVVTDASSQQLLGINPETAPT